MVPPAALKLVGFRSIPKHYSKKAIALEQSTQAAVAANSKDLLELLRQAGFRLIPTDLLNSIQRELWRLARTRSNPTDSLMNSKDQLAALKLAEFRSTTTNCLMKVDLILAKGELMTNESCSKLAATAYWTTRKADSTQAAMEY